MHISARKSSCGELGIVLQVMTVHLYQTLKQVAEENQLQVSGAAEFTPLAPVLFTIRTRVNYKSFRLAFEQNEPAVCVKCYIYFDWQDVMQ
jgi:hypothetical protein